jgi:hypothetical protein
MTKGEIVSAYRHMSNEDRDCFDRWLKANAVVGSIFAAALMAMAVAGSDPGPRHAMAQVGEASAATSQDDGLVSPSALTIRLSPDQIPVQQVDEPF